jgi:hypothetical protein
MPDTGRAKYLAYIKASESAAAQGAVEAFPFDEQVER